MGRIVAAGVVAAIVLTSRLVAEGPVAGVLDFQLPSAGNELLDEVANHARQQLATALERQLEDAGYRVQRIDQKELCDPAMLTASRFSLLCVPVGSVLPAAAMGPVQEYLRGGGDIIALGAPLWQVPLIEAGRRWTTREEYARALAGKAPDHVLFDFQPESIAKWQRSSNHPEFATQYKTICDGPAPGQRALHAVLTNLDGWDVFGLVDLPKAFPDGHTLTVFSAKGGPRTTRIVVEWVEKDGSRWMAVVPVGPEWTCIALPPEAFKYWESVPARAGTRFRPENTSRMSVGLAFSHTGQVGGRHEYWIGPFGTAPKSPEYAPLVENFSPPVLDTLSLGYKLFECSDVESLRRPRPEGGYDAISMPLPGAIRSPHPRPAGGGFEKGRAWRWTPLLEARSAEHAWRGTPATLTVHFEGPYAHGAWASFGVQQERWYLQPDVQRLIGQTARRIRRGLFILDGGADHYTCFDGKPFRLGLRVGNITVEERAGLTGRVCVMRAGTGEKVFERSWPLTIPASQVVSQSVEYRPTGAPVQGYLVVAKLLEGETVIDEVHHEAHVRRSREHKQFVTVADGDFQLDGRRWRAHGINYMPSSGIGTDDYDYFEHWLGARAYDPEIIQRDLEHIKDLGMNAVSIFIDHRSIKAGNLLDLLRRLDALGMKANLSLRPGTPIDFQWDKMREIIEHYRLAECDTVFAYDLAWEPMWRGHKERKPYDREWEAWIVERYGSIENAERDWAFKVPREADGKVTNPLPHQIDTDGDWRRMVAAYRRFLDTLLYQRYGAARRLVRNIDPNHLVSFRMTEAGNPTFKVDGWMVYDFPYLAGAVDMLAPEAYGRLSADWERVKPAIFEAEYGRWAAPDKPFIWAEAGVSAWDVARGRSEPGQLEYQAAFYRHFYRAIIDSGADGIFYWWYPGGFRVGENSDYGIINPDGTDRPVTKVIREHARKFLDGPSPQPVNHWIEFDRDAHTDGITGAYNVSKDEFWKAIAAGKTPGLRTAGTGTDSTNCPPLAVGNTPWNGTNPPKYLDAAFDSVEVLAADGKWTAVAKGGRVKVQVGKPAMARVILSNPGEAKWIDLATAGEKPGGVRLVTQAKERSIIPIPAAVPRFGETKMEGVELLPAESEEPQEVTLFLEAANRASFGERFQITLEPQQ